MKKLFIVLVVAAFGFVACNNDADNKPAEDSVIVSSEPTPAPSIDTLAAKIDSAKADSALAAKIDSAMAH